MAKKNYYSGFCPLCSKPIPVVKGAAGSLSFDCFYCGSAGRFNKLAGVVEEDVSNLQERDWRKWGKRK